MLCANNLSKRFGGRELFSSLRWQIGRGDKIGLVGDNGAGKSTLLKMLAGELVADDGQVVLSAGERVGYLPQEMPREAAGSIEARVASGDARMVQATLALEAATARLAAAEDATPTQALALTEALVEAQQRSDQLGAANYPGRIEQALLGLGFARSQFSAPLTSLSGGWAMRVELARLLVGEPDYLLLDEPTNHLDRASLGWLAGFLRGYRGAWIIVSHDHAFLDQSVSSIAALEAGELVQVRGSHAQYVAWRQAYAEEQAAAGKKVAAKAAHLEAFIARFGAKASKAKQAQSKAKALAKLTADAPAVVAAQQRIRIRMRVATPSGPSVLRADRLAHGFTERPLFAGVSLAIARGERLAIVGHNGAGKSTLLKLLAKAMPPNEGSVVHGPAVQPFVFGQHQADALDLGKTVLETMRQAMPSANDTAVRTLLGAFLFKADAMARPVKALSGGEKSRLALAKMVASPTNLLLLDEPTNHLDATSRQVLADALASYDGTLVIVSHDDELVTRLATCFVALDGHGSAQFSYRKPQEPPTPRGAAGNGTPPGQARGQPVASKSGAARRAQKASQAERRARAKEVAALEAKVQAAESRLKAIDTALLAPETFADPVAGSLLLKERVALEEEELPSLLDAWERAAAAAEAHESSDGGTADG